MARSARPARKLAQRGYAFCDVLYNWDTGETPYGGGAFIDRPATLDAASVRRYPFANDEAVCVADFDAPFGDRSARVQAARQVEKARAMGFSVHSAFEFEFMVLAETPESLRKKDFRAIEHFAQGNRTYSLQSAAKFDTLLDGLTATMARLEIGLDSIHSELGPGCFEAPLAHAAGLKGADDAALFKNFAKAYFLREGLMAAFMSKMAPSMPGQSGHFHISLREVEGGAPIFPDAQGPDGLSRRARWFIGGVIRLMPEMLVLCSHTVNAYKRMVPGAWAPTYASWGVQNRTAALRVINDAPDATRVERAAEGFRFEADALLADAPTLGPAQTVDAVASGPALLMIRPEKITLAPDPAPDPAPAAGACRIDGVVEEFFIKGASIQYRGTVDGLTAPVIVETPGASAPPADVGRPVRLSFDRADLFALPEG